MIIKSHNKLEELGAFILLLNDEQYTTPVEVLSGSSIGQHVRHIIEFYVCLLREKPTGFVCYDDRERNHKIETSRLFANVAIENIIIMLSEIESDRPVKLKANFSIHPQEAVILESSLFRELAYNLEHTIHHEALIKVAFNQLNIAGIILGDFGVALSTVRHENKKKIR
ncbi:MAG: DinB family protein [Cyclobacteriaceae bacterium]